MTVQIIGNTTQREMYDFSCADDQDTETPFINVLVQGEAEGGGNVIVFDGLLENLAEAEAFENEVRMAVQGLRQRMQKLGMDTRAMSRPMSDSER